MRWSILTPELSIHWDGETLTEGPGATRADAPAGDPLEEIWHTYYATIFNPARLKVDAMLKEMPKKYWRNMPETSLVQPLIAGAQARELEMIDRSVAKDGLEARARGRTPHRAGRQPARLVGSAAQGRAQAARAATSTSMRTQTVFGEGPLDASIMFVGEQPGDQEDLAGRPFVGPAGQLFDAALEKAGIDRASVYVTNAVKHFKFEQRGKRRIHNKPDAGEIEACRWWIEQERDADPAAGDRRARRDRGALAARQGRDDRQGPRRAADACRRRRMLGHRPPELPPAHPRRGPRAARNARCSSATSSASRRAPRSLRARSR